ncbi:MAG: acyltransferase domain-containing protein [Actinobacteria bacterium]|nr:acyltransferase domain-containing protein [Actinomycetota bacterium]
MALRLAVVFPGQGTPGGEVSGEIREAVRQYDAGDGELPYQLSIFASSIDTFHKLEEHGIKPDVVAGHSLGEYAAAYAAGSLGLEDGIWLVAERDRLMTEASAQNPGGMTAIIGAGAREVVDAVDSANGAIVAANFNTYRRRRAGEGGRRTPRAQGPDALPGAMGRGRGAARGVGCGRGSRGRRGDAHQDAAGL